MPLEGEYAASPVTWVREQVERYEASDGRDAGTLLGTGLPVVIVTSVGASSGRIRKTPLMRVESDGRYLAVASQGGAPEHPAWYANLLAHPHVELQDGPQKNDRRVRELHGAERDQWWDRAVRAYPPYEEYQRKTDRQIPLLLLELD